MKPLLQTIVLSSIAAMLPAAANAHDEETWMDRIELKGDIRLRHESIDEDGEVDRRRARFRTRFGLSAQATDDVKIVLQLASGGDDPVSTNQSFDDGFSTKDIGVDLAYVDWKAADSVNVFGGKMKNPLFRAGGTGLIWDGDLNPEGVAVKYSRGMFFGTAGVFSVEERSSSDDSLLYALQAGVKHKFGSAAVLTAGLGYFAYSNTVGSRPFYDGSANGNSVDASGNYVNEYKDTEVFAQLDTRLGSWPFRLFAHIARNNEVSVEDTAIAFGAKLGAARDKGTMEFSWTYQDLEADSVIGTYSDSDFGGGGTDASGHILKGKYALSRRVSLGGTLFVNEVDRFRGMEHDYARLQLDVEFKFE